MQALQLLALLFIVALSTLTSNAQKPDERKLINLGSNVNSTVLEINPRVSGDDNTLYFVRGDAVNKDIQEIWISQKDSNGNWGIAERLEKPLNTGQSNSVVSVSEDGSQLLIKGFYKKGKLKRNGYSIVSLGKEGWKAPQGLIIKEYDKFDKGLYNNACISSDYKVLIFSISNQKKVLDNDLYISFRGDDNVYSAPVKLDDNINIKGYMEFASFIAPDNKTLYFTSNKPGGIGATDIYKSERLDDTWLKWSDPENLGDKVNGPGRDGYYSVNSKGTHAYMVSDSNSLGLGDIVMIELAQKPKPLPTVLFKGNIKDGKTKNPLNAIIEYHILPADTLKGEILADTIGNYDITLPYSEKYLIVTHLHGYVSTYDTISVPQNGENMEIVKDYLLTEIIKGEVVVLKNVNFENNSAVLTPDSNVELDKVANFLLQNTEVEILIGGHTDNVGKAEKNRVLSDNRAKTVMDYLIAKGVEARRLAAKGFGQTAPLAENNTPENRALNRRVEFTITVE